MSSMSESDEVARLRAELAQKDEQLRLLRDLNPAVVHVFDVDTLATDYVNRHIAEDLGFGDGDPELTDPRATLALLHPDDIARITERNRRWDEVANGAVVETEYRLRHKDGSWRWYISRSQVLTRDADGKVKQVVGSALDITERKDIELGSQRSEKLESLGRLAGGIAHDFNNLLTVVLGNVALAKVALDLHEDVRTHLDDIAKVAEEAATISRQLLGFSRMQMARPEVIDTNQALRDSETLLRRLIDRADITFVYGESWPIKVDRGQLNQSLLHLLANARDAGGEITVSTGRFSVDRAGGRFAPGRWVRIRVEDTGQGMSLDVLQRMFDPFFSTKDKSVGATGQGLGLALVYGFVRKHHGTIDVDSEPGRGTRVDVYLPAVDEPRIIDVPPQHIVRPHDKVDERTLVILAEDEPMVAELTRRILTMGGHRVLVAPDGAEALELIRQHRDEVSLVVSDIVMPRVSGIDLAARLHAESPEIPVLLASGYPEDEQQLSLSLPRYTFLAKPFRAQELLDLVSGLIAQSRAENP